MNTKKIVDKITSNREYWLDLIKSKNGIDDSFYSNFDFINSFKDRGSLFWLEVILKSNIPIDELFKQYGEYLFDDKLYFMVDDWYRLHDLTRFKVENRIIDYQLEYNNNFIQKICILKNRNL